MTGHQSEHFAGTERFTVLRQIGAGGMGVVYEAHDRERNEPLVLNLLSGDPVWRLFPRRT